MPNFLLGCIVGCLATTIVVFIIDCIINTRGKYARNCLNCSHCIPWSDSCNRTKLYCDFAINNNVTTYPVSTDGYCGHFQLTEELKAEQVKDKAEKLVRK